MLHLVCSSPVEQNWFQLSVMQNKELTRGKIFKALQ